MKMDSESAASNPTGFLAFVAGDFNFEKADFNRVSYAKPTTTEKILDRAERPRAEPRARKQLQRTEHA